MFRCFVAWERASERRRRNLTAQRSTAPQRIERRYASSTTVVFRRRSRWCVKNAKHAQNTRQMRLAVFSKSLVHDRPPLFASEHYAALPRRRYCEEEPAAGALGKGAKKRRDGGRLGSVGTPSAPSAPTRGWSSPPPRICLCGGWGGDRHGDRWCWCSCCRKANNSDGAAAAGTARGGR